MIFEDKKKSHIISSYEMKQIVNFPRCTRIFMIINIDRPVTNITEKSKKSNLKLLPTAHE